LQEFGAQHNNFIGDTKKDETEVEQSENKEKSLEESDKEDEKENNGKPIINDKNFPTDINIVDKEELIYQQNRIRNNNKN